MNDGHKLAIGVGCRRGTSRDALAEFIARTLAANGFSVDDIAVLATSEIKADEPGLVALANECGWRLLTYSAEQLAGVDVPSASATVSRLTGTPGVAEAAAILAANGPLLAPKTKSAAITVAVARIVAT